MTKMNSKDSIIVLRTLQIGNCCNEKRAIDYAIKCIKKYKKYKKLNKSYSKFCHWLAKEIFSSDLDNTLTEMICRKLNEIGIIETDSQNNWVYYEMDAER